jgi:hypothetical protein
MFSLKLQMMTLLAVLVFAAIGMWPSAAGAANWHETDQVTAGMNVDNDLVTYVFYMANVKAFCRAHIVAPMLDSGLGGTLCADARCCLCLGSPSGSACNVTIAHDIWDPDPTDGQCYIDDGYCEWQWGEHGPPSNNPFPPVYALRACCIDVACGD